ncbi:MAG: 2-C-methyl-D-erythritol 2,4-cyclodiphosphate synthase [Chitinivibrionales bacterium]
MFKSGIGQDSHRFEEEGSRKPLVIGGVHIPGCPGLRGNSDADVVLHALTNAISGISGRNILGKISDDMCLRQGITDSRAYLEKAMESLGNYRISHVSIAIEGRRPRFEPVIGKIQESLANLLSLQSSDIGITATTGEGLTAFGRGEGLQAIVIVSAEFLDGFKS